MTYKNSQDFLIELDSAVNSHEKISSILSELKLENPSDYLAITSAAFKHRVKSIIVGNLNFLRQINNYPKLSTTQEDMLLSFLKAYQSNAGLTEEAASEKFYSEMYLYFS
jgi:hypothetical protein